MAVEMVKCQNKISTLPTDQLKVDMDFHFKSLLKNPSSQSAVNNVERQFRRAALSWDQESRINYLVQNREDMGRLRRANKTAYTELRKALFPELPDTFRVKDGKVVS